MIARIVLLLLSSLLSARQSAAFDVQAAGKGYGRQT
jgi:hypothetical protein